MALFLSLQRSRQGRWPLDRSAGFQWHCMVGEYNLWSSLTGPQHCSRRMAPYIIIIIMKRISRAPIYRTRWVHMALYKRTRTHTHTHTCACAHARASDEGIYRHGCDFVVVEMTVKQVCLEGGFKRGGTIRVAECLRQIVPNRWASVRKRSFTNFLFVCFFLSLLFTKG